MEEVSNPTQITDLPPELIGIILEYLDYRSTTRFLQSSLRLGKIGDHPAISNVVNSKGQKGMLACIRSFRNSIELRIYRKSIGAGMCSTEINLQGIGAERLKRLSDILKSGKEIEWKKLGDGYITSSYEPGLVEWVALTPGGREIVNIEIDKIVLQRLLEETAKILQNNERGDVSIFNDRTVLKSVR